MAAVLQHQAESRAEALPETEAVAPLARLAALHAEAEETARLANLLGRSLYAGIALPLAAGAIAFLSNGASLAARLAWCALILGMTFTFARAYRAAIRRPFERASLKSFAQDFGAILLYAGFAWGAGAFLALPAGQGAVAMTCFAVLPAALLALLLREREAAFLFLAPPVALTAFACVLKPSADGALDAASVLIAGGLVTAAILAAGRRSRETQLLPQA